MTFEVPLERGKIREFAHATKSRNRRYRDVDAMIPVTFLTTARFFWEPRDQSPFRELGFDMRRVLHGEEEYVFHGPPPRAGTTLIATSRLDAQWTASGRRGGNLRFARIVCEFRDESGALVAEQRSTLVETSRAVASP